MSFDPVTAIVDAGKTVIDKLIPDAKTKQVLNYKLLQLAQDGEFRELEIRMKAIVAEAQSQDKWTSRARPSFLYVIYLMILASIPMGGLYAFYPDTAGLMMAGVKAWLQAIPAELWALFGAGYLGYTFTRTKDKAVINKLLK